MTPARASTNLVSKPPFYKVVISETQTGDAGMAIVEIVDFQGQTASTTYFEIQTASTIIYMKINYQPTDSTDSKVVLIF